MGLAVQRRGMPHQPYDKFSAGQGRLFIEPPIQFEHGHPVIKRLCCIEGSEKFAAQFLVRQDTGVHFIFNPKRKNFLLSGIDAKNMGSFVQDSYRPELYLCCCWIWNAAFNIASK